MSCPPKTSKTDLKHLRFSLQSKICALNKNGTTKTQNQMKYLSKDTDKRNEIDICVYQCQVPLEGTTKKE